MIVTGGWAAGVREIDADMIFLLGEQPAAEQGGWVGDVFAAVVEHELLRDQAQVRLDQIWSVSTGEDEISRVGSPTLVKRGSFVGSPALIHKILTPLVRACAL
jgi:hypothetical protein